MCLHKEGTALRVGGGGGCVCARVCVCMCVRPHAHEGTISEGPGAFL